MKHSNLVVVRLIDAPVTGTVTRDERGFSVVQMMRLDERNMMKRRADRDNLPSRTMAHPVNERVGPASTAMVGFADFAAAWYCTTSIPECSTFRCSAQWDSCEDDVDGACSKEQNPRLSKMVCRMYGVTAIGGLSAQSGRSSGTVLQCVSFEKASIY